MNKSLYTRRVLILIAALSVLRCIIGSTIELTTDESVYWLYSQVLKLNYFDHPPMVAIWIRLFTGNLLLDNYVLFLRLGSIVGCGLSTWFIYRCVSTLSNERAGWFAACLYNASFYAGISAGLLMFPDAPQMVFFTFSMWMIARITIDDQNWKYWILFGIGTGFCIMSKVFGIFLWVGLGLYILFLKRSWLANRRLYIALIIAMVMASPILIWNIQYHFATFTFNSERIITHGFSIDWNIFFSSLFEQVMINNPFNVVLILLALITWYRHKIYHAAALSIYNFIAFPLALLLLYISLYRSVLPHWSGPAFVALIPLAAIRLAEINNKILYPKIIRLSLGIYLIFMIASPFVINFYPGNFGSKINNEQGKADVTLDMYGWREAGKKFDTLYQKETTEGLMPGNSPVVCSKYWGAHVEYYFCKPLGIQMMGLGGMNNLHEYMWMNQLRKDKVNFPNAYCIVNSDDYYDVHTAYNAYYSQIDTIEVIQIHRNKQPAHNFYVFRLKGWKNNLPMVE